METPAPYQCESLYEAQQGVSVTEYAILLGLVLLLSVGGLQMLGGSVSALLFKTQQKTAENNTLQLLDKKSPTVAGSMGLNGSGYYGIVVDPATGQPRLSMVQEANATATNVSSIDGSMMNTLGATMVARNLEDLAAQQTDPKMQEYYAQMAKDAYYLAAAEGALDGVPGLAVNSSGSDKSTYTNGDALADIAKFSSALSNLMKNPPAGLSNADYLQAMPMAVNAYNIAHQYENAYSQFLNPDGKVPRNFGLPSACTADGGCPVGDGTPGSALANASQVVSNPSNGGGLSNQSYDQVMGYDQLKSNVDNVLASNQLDNSTIASTIQDAQGLSTMAQGQSSPGAGGSSVSDVASNTSSPTVSASSSTGGSSGSSGGSFIGSMIGSMFGTSSSTSTPTATASSPTVVSSSSSTGTSNGGFGSFFGSMFGSFFGSTDSTSTATTSTSSPTTSSSSSTSTYGTNGNTTNTPTGTTSSDSTTSTVSGTTGSGGTTTTSYVRTKDTGSSSSPSTSTTNSSTSTNNMFSTLISGAMNAAASSGGSTSTGTIGGTYNSNTSSSYGSSGSYNTGSYTGYNTSYSGGSYSGTGGSYSGGSYGGGGYGGR